MGGGEIACLLTISPRNGALPIGRLGPPTSALRWALSAAASAPASPEGRCRLEADLAVAPRSVVDQSGLAIHV